MAAGKAVSCPVSSNFHAKSEIRASNAAEGIHKSSEHVQSSLKNLCLFLQIVVFLQSWHHESIPEFPVEIPCFSIRHTHEIRHGTIA